MWSKVRLLLIWGIRVAVTWVFVSFAWGKLFEPEEFAEAIFRYRMLPDWGVNLMALGLPWLEFWCALALFVPCLRRAAWCWLMTLLVIFTLAKASALARGLDISCGCHGSGDGAGEFIRWQSIAFNLLILAGCVVATFLETRKHSSFGSLGRLPHEEER